MSVPFTRSASPVRADNRKGKAANDKRTAAEVSNVVFGDTGSATLTTINSVGVFEPILTANTGGSDPTDFTSPVAGTVTYTGAEGYFRITLFAQIASANGAQEVRVRPFRNGFAVGAIESHVIGAAAGVARRYFSSGSVFLESGDVISVYVANLTDTTDLTITDWSCHVTQY